MNAFSVVKEPLFVNVVLFVFDAKHRLPIWSYILLELWRERESVRYVNSSDYIYNLSIDIALLDVVLVVKPIIELDENGKSEWNSVWQEEYILLIIDKRILFDQI